ncbi:MAG: M20 family metallopeptidase [Patescibacteria group bacterium]
MLTKELFLEQLATLVSLRTLSSNAEENGRALDYIESLISPQAKVTRVQNNGAEIFLASNTDSMQPQYGYMVHVDVVAASEERFLLTHEGSRVMGRGVSDMKYSIPLGIALLNEVIETQTDLTFTLAVTTDEEVGGFNGAAHLSNQMHWQPEVLIVPDGGDNLNFVNKSKGLVDFTVTSRGTSAHASQPWRGKNAIPALAQLITKLEESYQKNTIAENWKTTVNFGRIEGGISTNQVCDDARLYLDYRYPESDSAERIEQELIELCKQISPNLSVERTALGMPTFTDTNLPVVQRFLRCLSETCGTEIEVKPTYGASDARHFPTIPVLMCKPIGEDIHQETEWLDVDSAMQFYEALREFLLK